MKCIICGKEFEKRGNKLTCSLECSYQNTRNSQKAYKKENGSHPKKKQKKKKNPEEVDSLTAKCIRAKEEGFSSYGKLQQYETWQWIRENGYGIGGEW